jgi:hypothetical protein
MIIVTKFRILVRTGTAGGPEGPPLILLLGVYPIFLGGIKRCYTKKKAVRVSSDSFLDLSEKLLFSNPKYRIKICVLIERTYLFT